MLSLLSPRDGCLGNKEHPSSLGCGQTRWVSFARDGYDGPRLVERGRIGPARELSYGLDPGRRRGNGPGPPVRAWTDRQTGSGVNGEGRWYSFPCNVTCDCAKGEVLSQGDSETSVTCDWRTGRRAPCIYPAACRHSGKTEDRTAPATEWKRLLRCGWLWKRMHASVDWQRAPRSMPVRTRHPKVAPFSPQQAHLPILLCPRLQNEHRE